MKIFNIFKESGCDIKSEEKLVEYIEFCISKDLGNKIPSQTSHHHILPQAKRLQFTEYADLDENPWNGTHLTYKDHYIAHAMLCEAIDHISIYTAFMAMNNKDVKLDRISAEDVEELAENYSYLLSEAYSARTAFMKEEIMHEGEMKTRYKIANQRGAQTKWDNGYYDNVDVSRLNTPEAIAKQIKTVKTIQPSGLTLAQEIARRGGITKKLNGMHRGRKNGAAKLKVFMSNYGKVEAVIYGNQKEFSEKFKISQPIIYSTSRLTNGLFTGWKNAAASAKRENIEHYVGYKFLTIVGWSLSKDSI